MSPHGPKRKISAIGSIISAFFVINNTCIAFTINTVPSCSTGNTLDLLLLRKKAIFPRNVIFSSPQNQESPTPTMEEEEEGEDIFGTKFFGGSAQKEELFDAVEEDRANSKFELVIEELETTTDTFNLEGAFEDDAVKGLGRRLQSSLNAVLYDVDTEEQEKGVRYSSDCVWEGPLSKSGSKGANPMEELKTAMEFYKSMDISIVSGAVSSRGRNQVEIRWEISVVWPNSWEARVTLSGSSTLVLSDETSFIITSQRDVLDNGQDDILKALSNQMALPRFWDVYNIGMSPSAEIMQRLPCTSNNKKGLFSNYNLFEIAPRITTRPILIDKLGRASRQAEALPNHAFTNSIITVGRKKESYVPVSPIEINISRIQKGISQIAWTVPIPPRISAIQNGILPTLTPDDFAPEDIQSCTYQYEQKRRVATVFFGGNPQDESVVGIREKLYSMVVKDGFTPKLLENGQPKFFYLMNDSKACFSDNGLGMAVYESRLKAFKGNEIGIELEMN